MATKTPAKNRGMTEEEAAASIAAVNKRKNDRKQKVIEEQRALLTKNIASKEFTSIHISANSRERLKVDVTCKGVFLYEFAECKDVHVEFRFFPYNALNGEFIQEDFGVIKEKKGEFILHEAGKVTFLFINPNSWFGAKNAKVRFSHANDLPVAVLKDQEETFSPMDVWWARRDPQTRVVYYINKELKQTKWQMPPGAHLANGRFAKKRKPGVEGNGDECTDSEMVHGNEYQQKMNIITEKSTAEDLPAELEGWFLKANRKGRLQTRFIRLERQYLHYYDHEVDYHNGKECKAPMNMFQILGTKIPSDNEGYEDHVMNDVHDCPFDIYTRDKILALVPDQAYFKGIISAVGDDKYDVTFDKGGYVEESVPGVLLRYQKGYGPKKKKKKGVEETGPPRQVVFKKGDRVEKQKDLKQSRLLARILKTWKPRIMSGWFMKCNRKGKQQKRWFKLLGTKMSYYDSPQAHGSKKEPLDLEMLDSLIDPSPRLGIKSSGLKAFDLVFSPDDDSKVPQTMEEKLIADKKDKELEESGAKDDALTFTTITIYPLQQDPSTHAMMQCLKDWQTHDELRFNVNKYTILDCKIKAHPKTAYGLVVTDVPKYKVNTGFPGHQKDGVRITQLLTLPDGDDGPAMESGVMLNDTLVAVDGIPVFRVQDAAKALKGKQSGIFMLCRLGDGPPEDLAKAKRSLLSDADKKVADEKEKAKLDLASRMKDETEMETQQHGHKHRHHSGKKSHFGALKVRAGWRSSTTVNGKPYWYHTNGKTTKTQPPMDQIIE